MPLQIIYFQQLFIVLLVVVTDIELQRKNRICLFMFCILHLIHLKNISLTVEHAYYLYLFIAH